MIEKNNKKITNAWCMYDWANSVFPLTITSAIFPIYWNSQTEQGVDFLGQHLSNTTFYAFCISFAFLVVAFINPILGGIADTAGNKKSFMRMFVILGSVSCAMLFFFDKHHIWVGAIAFIFATIGFAGSIVFYNAYLPEISTKDKMDSLSARGFSFGYIGAVLLLIMNLLLIMFPQLIFDVQSKVQELTLSNPNLSAPEIEKMAKSSFSGISSRIAFVSVGVWWFLFSLIPFKYLPVNKNKKAVISIKKGYQEINKVFKLIKQNKSIKDYLTAIFFSSMGVQTIMYVAGSFGDKELKLPKHVLIVTILIIQLVAVLGAFLTSKLSEKIGNIKTLMVLVCIWIFVCFYAYFVQGEQQFYILATVVGLIMGGIQSLSRSTYAKLIPSDSDENTSYFSFYELTEKVAIVIGTFAFGAIELIMYKITNETSMRYSIVSLFLFFVVSIVLLIRQRKVI